jgi:hypothetical protein
VGKLATVFGAEEDRRDAAVQGQRADRHREARQPQARDEQAVDRAGRQAGDGDRDEDGPHRPAVAPQHAEQGAGHAEDRRHRQVDLAADHDQRHRQRHDGDLAIGQAQVEHVAAGQELRRCLRAGDDDGHDDRREPGFPAGGCAGGSAQTFGEAIHGGSSFAAARW